MRNLKLQYCHLRHNIPITNVKSLLINPISNNEKDPVYLVTNDKIYKWIIGAGSPEELAEAPGIVGAEFLGFEICIATEVGEVLILNPETGEMNEGTFCDVGIEQMSWSPDQGVVVFVTKERSVVVMTCTYDPIAEHELTQQCNSDSQFVNVGWGKKETQFHGSEGKAVAKKNDEFQIPANINDLPQQIEITWRADGAYFAVSFVSDTIGRMFKVFDKEGKLAYTSERQNNLQFPISWRPSGTWIAMPHQLPNKSTVALFEKNGLRHREIILPFNFDTENINSLKWSPDSDILTVETRNSVTNENILYLYTISNYHWYIKQVLIFKGDDPISVYTWDNRMNEEKRLHIVLQSGKYLTYRWYFGTCKLQSAGVAAVIDGKKLLLTDFSKAVIPPPMCHQQIEFDAYVNACVITEDKELYVMDSKSQIHMLRASIEKSPMQFEKIATLQPNKQMEKIYPSQFGNFGWLKDNYLVASTITDEGSQLYCIYYDTFSKAYEIRHSTKLDEKVTALMTTNLYSTHFFAQASTGEIYQYTVDMNNLTILNKLPYTSIKDSVDELEWFQNFIISFRINQCLYLDNHRIATDVTSFCVTGNYLAFTKLTSLHFMRLDDRRIVNERKIERGGKLITIITNNSRTILQMPRGNLEAIFPRILSLANIGELLDVCQYNLAMDVLRKERINLNIICDHNMARFIECLDTFLSDIKNPNWLNLFLSDLQNEDYTVTMYASNYRMDSQRYPEGFKISEKVSFLCEKLLENMEKSNDRERYRLPIITAYVKMGKLEKALDMIWNEKKREAQDAKNSHHAEDSLKYLLYLVDINELYNVALGTYDFGLVLFVLQKSQKDPKEFLPFLNELKKHEPNYRKFKIDEHLKRYEKAVQHISLCGIERLDEALVLIKRHGLYKSALQSYSTQKECHDQICLAYADYLRSNNKLENASLMYERGGNIRQAMLSAKNALDWKRTLTMAKLDGQQVNEIALSMVPSLEEHDKFDDAYFLLRTYGNDFSEAIHCLTRAKRFSKAIFEVQMHESTGDSNLIDTLIKPDLINYHNVLESNVQADLDLYLDYKKRLLAVRELKAKKKEEQEECEDNVNVDECDLFSDTTSMNSSQFTSSSRGTGKTFRSSKNRRKHERKILSLKPGNPFEDIALIDALYNLIMKVVNQQQHIHEICKALLELQLDDAGASLQHKFKHLLNLIQNSLDEIWIPEMMTAQQFLTGPNIDYTQLQNEQRYGMINPQKRFKPQNTVIDWEHEILR